MGFNGPTDGGIRSAKHDESSAATHQCDLATSMHLPELSSCVRMLWSRSSSYTIGVDEGPHEAPSSSKAPLSWAHCFRQHQFDAAFAFCNVQESAPTTRCRDEWLLSASQQAYEWLHPPIRYLQCGQRYYARTFFCDFQNVFHDIISGDLWKVSSVISCSCITFVEFLIKLGI